MGRKHLQGQVASIDLGSVVGKRYSILAFSVQVAAELTYDRLHHIDIVNPNSLMNCANTPVLLFDKFQLFLVCQNDVEVLEHVCAVLIQN